MDLPVTKSVELTPEQQYEVDRLMALQRLPPSEVLRAKLEIGMPFTDLEARMLGFIYKFRLPDRLNES
jgi:hypothetical protein